MSKALARLSEGFCPITTHGKLVVPRSPTLCTECNAYWTMDIQRLMIGTCTHQLFAEQFISEPLLYQVHEETADKALEDLVRITRREVESVAHNHK